MIRSIPVSTKLKSEKFLREGLDSRLAGQPVGQITQGPFANGRVHGAACALISIISACQWVMTPVKFTNLLPPK
jgi:hypothetical protein